MTEMFDIGCKDTFFLHIIRSRTEKVIKFNENPLLS
jgi:hypothetical protein